MLSGEKDGLGKKESSWQSDQQLSETKSLSGWRISKAVGQDTSEDDICSVNSDGNQRCTLHFAKRFRPLSPGRFTASDDSLTHCPVLLFIHSFWAFVCCTVVKRENDFERHF